MATAEDANITHTPDYTGQTIVTGIVCTRCGVTLPPHTMDEHLDAGDIIHDCPHIRSLLRTAPFFMGESN